MARQSPSLEAQDRLKKAVLGFVQPTEEALAAFVNAWHVKTYQKNAYLCQEGEVERYFYFITKGVQRIFFLKPDGYEHVMGFSYDGNFSGVADSFLGQKKSNLYLQALTLSEALVIDYSALNNLFDQYKVWERWGRIFFTQILIGRAQREIEMLTLSAEERYQLFVDRQPAILQQIPQKQLASYLGMTPETFSRLRNKARSTQ